MAKMRKPFVSRKRRKEMQEARERRENLISTQVQNRRALDTLPAAGDKQSVFLPPIATVGEFAVALNLPVTRVMSQLIKNGIMATITDRVDFDSMSIVADELGFIAQEVAEAESAPVAEPTNTNVTEGTESRPPVVTVMGHVDHGKTSLLDRIRKTHIAAGEHGGITQHIGAYQTEIEYEGKSRLITFLDTPGHEAFSALRSHGAQVTDIVILVVAADDGVKPQTIEAISHAKNANVPIIVAITKMDTPGANSERVKQQLTEQGLIPEEWGGSTVMMGVSSLTGDGIQALLEYIVLTADLKNLKADPDRTAQGVVIESHQEIGLGPVATLLIQNGTLAVGDVLVIGGTYGKVRSMIDYLGKRVKTALPSMPVRISGLQSIPSFGESFAAVKTEREARDLTEKFATQTAPKAHGIESISQAIAEGKANVFKIVLKADTQGSLEALRTSINKLHEPGVKPQIIHSGIGDISLTDIQLASSAQAVVFGFHTSMSSQVKKTADTLGVTVATFTIIYDLLNQVELTLKGRVRTNTIKSERGRLKVKKVFRTTKESQIIGGEITQGVAINKAFATLMREGEELGDGKILSLQKGPEIMGELEAGQDCGLSVQFSQKVLEGDMIVFKVEEQVIIGAESPGEDAE